ncbi:MAG: ABC transporter permease [Proteobacteria bacterium]|nr:MAG: ABC transporter permease [Pseudomonadota bacterium]
MRTLRRSLLRFAGLFRRRRVESELAREIESHLEMHVADNLRAGMTHEQARREALLRLGGVETVKEEYRAQSTAPWLEHLVLDLRFAMRQFRKSPSFAVTAVGVLAFATCAATAIFAFVDAALIRPLPYPDPKTLAMVTETGQGFRLANLSYLDYQDWKRFNTSLRSLEVFTGSGFLLHASSGTMPVPGAAVSGGFFQTLGVQPLVGRSFLPDEERAGGPLTVMLSHRIWQQHFGGSRSVVGQAVRLSGEVYTIVGVLPADFQFAPLGAAGIWTLLDTKNSCAARRSCHNLTGIARVQPGISTASALADLSTVAKRLEQQYPDSNRERGASVIPFAQAVTGEFRPVLMVLLACAGLLLAIGLVNVTGLVLARSEARRHELAMRTALGASRTRLYSQFASESLVLAFGGSVVGVAAAHQAMRILKTLIPADMIPGMPFLQALGLNRDVLAFAAAAALLAIALFSAAPALHYAIGRVRNGLREGSRGTSGRAWRRLGSRLVIVELAIAMVLLVGAGLLGKSLYRLLHVELGFRPDRLAMIDVAGPDILPDREEQGVRVARTMLAQIAGLPGVQSVALTTLPPVTYNGNTDWVRIVGKPYDGKHIEVNERDVSTAFFQAIGAKLLAGRYPNDGDDLGKPLVVVINQAFAKQYFPGEDPVGKQIGDTSLTPKSIHTIIGVVEDIRDGALDAEIWPAEYHPFQQDPSSYFVLMARTSQKAEAILPLLGPAIHQVLPDVGTKGETTMEARIDNSMTAYLHRSAAWVVGGFAAMALLLGVVGLYGVIAYSVSQRTREIGVRIALGAKPGAVYRMVLGEAGWLVLAGIGVGAACSIGAGTLAAKLLFGIKAWDAPTLAGVGVLLAAAAAAASFAPARRAASVNPVEALRSE